MASETVVMPRLWEDMQTGVVVEWVKKEGDKLQKGDVVLRVETEKVTADVEAILSGTVGKILAPVGSEVPVGNPIYTIEVV